MRTNSLLIRTPEGITFSLLLAGPVTRFLAWLLDFFVVMVVTIALGHVLSLARLLSVDLATALGVAVYFAVSIGYGMALEWFWRGQTIGKRLLRLRVMDAQGLRLRPSQIVIRNLLRFVDGLPFFYLVGGIATLVSQRGQRLGDFAANTIVMRNPKLPELDLDQLLAGKFNSLRQYPHLAARLRQRVSPREAGLALQALLRRDELEPAARVELFEQLSRLFREHVAFPQEATDGISDEQYVRNVVDIVFRDRTGSGNLIHRAIAA